MKNGYKVNEIFTSVQGEGLLIGRPSTFIRLQGCPVGCSWCDSGPLADEIEGKRRTNGTTANTWGPGGEWMTIDDIIPLVATHHVIITGGEPVIWNLDELIWAIRAADEHAYIQLETSGLNALKGHEVPDWVTWSPKENLDWQAPMGLKDMAREVKFVIDGRITERAIQKVVDYYHYEIGGGILREFVLMPEGCPPDEISIGHTLGLMNGPDIDWHHFPVRMGLRAQYYLKMR